MRNPLRRSLSALAALALVVGSLLVASPAQAATTQVDVTLSTPLAGNGDTVRVDWWAADVNFGQVSVSIEGMTFFSSSSFALNGANAHTDIQLNSLADGVHLVRVDVSAAGYTGTGYGVITIDAAAPSV